MLDTGFHDNRVVGDRRGSGGQGEILGGVISGVDSEQGHQVAKSPDEDVARIQRQARSQSLMRRCIAHANGATPARGG
jgi:hypothetical protein